MPDRPVHTAARLALLAAAVLAPAAAVAATADQQFAVKGIGASACERFIDIRAKDRSLYYMYLGWIDGYVTASNKYIDDTFDLAAWQSTELLATAIQTQCEKDPSRQVASIVDALTGQMVSSRLRQASEVVTAEVDGTEFHIYAGVVRRIQRVLAEDGFYEGPVDGQYGATTRIAVERFQQDAGIPVTGLPDNLTMFQLLGSTEAAE